MVSKQAESIAADIVSKGGTVRRGKLMTFDTQAVALIAYLQRLGADLSAPPVANKADDATDSVNQEVSDARTTPRDAELNKLVSAVP